jgi:hypothetical protein
VVTNGQASTLRDVMRQCSVQPLFLRLFNAQLQLRCLRCFAPPQTVAIMYLALTCFIQLSILLTRNPSLWWHFSSRR